MVSSASAHAIRLGSLVALALAIALPSEAQESETFLLEGKDRAGQTLESRVTLTTRADGTLWLERIVRGPGGTQRRAGIARPLRGSGAQAKQASETRVQVDLPELLGAAGRLSGAVAGPSLRATYRFRGGQVRALVREGGKLVARESGRRLGAPAPIASYTLTTDASSDVAAIDVAAINADASALLRSLTTAERELPYPVIVVPGFASEDQGDTRLHPRTKKRARRAAALLREKGAHVILCSGANVHPANTPFNEALELRRYLTEELGVPPWRVAIDPRARHTTTNMRNAGRFLLAHGLDRALVVTSRGQSFYLSAPRISSFHRRCRKTLGYEVGTFRVRSHWTTLFKPTRKVFTRGPDPLDP